MRSLACAVLLIAACGGNDDRSRARAADDDEATAVATDPIEKSADDELAAIDGLRPGVAPANSLRGLDGVAPFAGAPAAPECAAYGKAVGAWFDEFPAQYERLENHFSPDAEGAAAMRTFAGFLRRGATELGDVTVDGEDLARAHAQFVAALQDLAGGFEQLADGLEARKEQRIAEAAHRVDNAVGNFRTALDELVKLCGE